MERDKMLDVFSLFFGFIVFLVFLCILGAVLKPYNTNKNMSARDKQELEFFQQKDVKAKEVAKRRRISPTQRKAVLERDGYKCRICGISRQYLDDKAPGLGEYLRLEIDHIVPVAQGGTSDESNLQCLCWRCNSLKGSKKTNKQVNSLRKWGAGFLPGLDKRKSLPEIR
jgi:HNH endonuclease domain protein